MKMYHRQTIRKFLEDTFSFSVIRKANTHTRRRAHAKRIVQALERFINSFQKSQRWIHSKGKNIKRLYRNEGASERQIIGCRGVKVCTDRNVGHLGE